jgi:Rps23 Pro-64 3,4-dihydroxylase Tpa1-like proline 4-hydroxylase
MHLFDSEHFIQLAEKHRDAYSSVEPFAHTVIDDFLPPEVLDGVLAEFPAPGERWRRLSSANQAKLAAQRENQFGKQTRDVLRECNSAGCLHFLETLTGIQGLIPDPHLEGGGLHQIERGGFLKVHVDFNKHPRLNLDRRVNLIVYLNKDWKEEYNGHLELWDRTMSRCVSKILPIFNRAVVFNTTGYAYHGHPERLTCPPGRTRKSLALYYYTNGRPPDELAETHGTLWQERQGGWEAGQFSATVLRGMATLLERPARWMRKRANRLTQQRSPMPQPKRDLHLTGKPLAREGHVCATSQSSVLID